MISSIMRTTMRKARFMPPVVTVKIHQSKSTVPLLGVKEVQYAGEDDDEYERLEALQEALEPDAWRA